jgi:hypothetical protein
MKTLIVGGDFGKSPKSSSVITKLAIYFNHATVLNGGTLEEIAAASNNCTEFDVVLWMPNISNEIEKIYPQKGRGALLFCSKVLRENRSEADAIARIFRMNGNAVLAISKEGNLFSFKLIDALGNCWIKTSELNLLAEKMLELTAWTNSSIRTATKTAEFEFPEYPDELEKLVELNKIVADNFEAIGSRYFGNVSTRCMKMFPSVRLDSLYMLVSRRNSDKKRLSSDDFVKVRYQSNIEYLGLEKPSVDTAIQVNIYKNFPNINFIIHGHGYIDGMSFTKRYYPCGDLREFEEIRPLLEDNGILNLINHGFIIFANNIAKMELLVKNLRFSERAIGNEIPLL